MPLKYYDDELVRVPAVVQAETKNGLSAWSVRELRRVRAHVPQVRTLFPCTWWWVDTFDQDPVEIPTELRGGGLCVDGRIAASSPVPRTLLRIMALDNQSGMYQAPPLNRPMAQFLSLFLDDESARGEASALAPAPATTGSTKRVDLTRQRPRKPPVSTIRGATMGPGYAPREVGYDDAYGEEFEMPT